MKPDDMHAAVEEVDLDPCDLYTDLGILIIEGRVPGLTDKGFGEGPHCPGPHAQNRHQCDPANAECQKYEQILKHMLLLWKNGIPMTIEVLLYPSCCIPSQNVESVPDTSYLLLEQWTIHMLPRRMPDASISSRGLIQAVRSFLYFSQLCAWFSLTGGKSPKNVHYRVCVPGEAFSSKFSSPPDCHIFPVANVGRNAAMKVLMKSHPRCGEIPTLRCHQHSPTHHPLSSLKAKCLWTSDRKQTRAKHEEESAAGEYPFDGVLHPGSTTDLDRCRHLTGVAAATASSSRTSSPADSMLGESLLDPPNALCMYAKRYQSPSRCGSPSIEVPEHLMFGKREDSPPIPPPIAPPRRSRPQRRPVVERFLKKDEVDPSTTGCRTFDKRASTAKEIPLMVRDYPNTRPNILTMSEKDEMLNYCCRTFDKRTSAKGLLHKDFFDKRICATKDYPASKAEKDEVLGYCCIEDCMKDVPREEMEQVLERLSERHGGGRPKCRDGHCLSDQKGLHKKSLSQLIDEMKINSNLVEQNNNELKKSVFHKNTDLCDSKSLFKQALRLNKESSSRKFDRNTKSISSYETLSSLPEVHNNNHRMQHKNNFKNDHLEEQTAANQLLANKLNRLESSTYFHNKNDDRLRDAPKPNSSEAQSASRPGHQHDSDIHPRLGSVNIKKCGAFLLRDDNAGELNDEREISPRWLDEDDILPTSFLIPSAEKKALFRRSLDSATSLVFHQRSGLPLTSSPAPVRKSGTCFDFDSSITSVSAIKRALFEKELEEDKTEKENSINLSNSAPASIVSSSLLGTFEESVLNGRLEPVSTVEGFTAEIGASGSFCPRHITLPVTVFFYTLQDMDKVTSPYMGHIDLRDKDYHIPKRGTVQVTLFNPHGTVVKMFVVRYDLSDMPVNCQTFLRQRTLYMPPDACPENDPEAQKWLRYLIHLRFMSSKSGRIYLHTDIRVIIFRKSDLDAATVHGQRPYELRSFTHGPLNPKFSSHNKP